MRPTTESEVPVRKDSVNETDPAVAPALESAPPEAEVESCPEASITHTQEVIDNLPYLGMLVLGSAIFCLAVHDAAWRSLSAALYFAYGIGGALWIIAFVCPYCHFYDTRLCPCGYGQIAARLSARKDGDRFAAQFKRHIPVIFPLWFAPPIVAVIALVRDFSTGLLALLLVFVLNSFVVLPLVSREYGCANCPQKDRCPWMGTCRTPQEQSQSQAS